MVVVGLGLGCGGNKMQIDLQHMCQLALPPEYAGTRVAKMNPLSEVTGGGGGGGGFSSDLGLNFF